MSQSVCVRVSVCLYVYMSCWLCGWSTLAKHIACKGAMRDRCPNAADPLYKEGIWGISLGGRMPEKCANTNAPQISW